MSGTFSPSGGLSRHRTGTQSHRLKQKWATESEVVASWLTWVEGSAAGAPKDRSQAPAPSYQGCPVSLLLP